MKYFIRDLLIVNLLLFLCLAANGMKPPRTKCAQTLGPTVKEQAMSYQDIPKQELAQRFLDVVSLKYPLVRQLLMRMHDGHQQNFVIKLLTGGLEPQKLLVMSEPKLSWLEIPRPNRHEPLVRFLDKVSTIAAVERYPNDSDFGMTHLRRWSPAPKFEERDYSDMLSICAILYAVHIRTDVRDLLYAHLIEGNELPQLLKPLQQFQDAYADFVKVDKLRLPRGNFIRKKTAFWKQIAGVFGLSALSSLVLDPFLPGAATAAASAVISIGGYAGASWYSLGILPRRFAKTVRRMNAAIQPPTSVSQKLSSGPPTLFLEKPDAPVLTAFLTEWLDVPPLESLTNDEQRMNFFAGLEQAIQWTQHQLRALRSDTALQDEFTNLKTFLERSLSQRRERDLRLSLDRFVTVYPVINRHLKLRLHELDLVDDALQNMKSSIDAHLEIATSRMQELEGIQGPRWLKSFSEEALYWSEWPERLDQLSQAIQLDVESLSRLQTLLRDQMPLITSCQAAPCSKQAVQAQRAVLKSLLEVAKGFDRNSAQ